MRAPNLNRSWVVFVISQEGCGPVDLFLRRYAFGGRAGVDDPHPSVRATRVHWLESWTPRGSVGPLGRAFSPLRFTAVLHLGRCPRLLCSAPSALSSGAPASMGLWQGDRRTDWCAADEAPRMRRRTEQRRGTIGRRVRQVQTWSRRPCRPRPRREDRKKCHGRLARGLLGRLGPVKVFFQVQSRVRGVPSGNEQG